MNIVIVGAGITGLYVGLEILRRTEGMGHSVSIYTQSGYVGGRVFTKERDGIQFEAGAGRIAKGHRYTMNLLKQFQLESTLIPITNDISIRNPPHNGLRDGSPETIVKQVREKATHEQLETMTLYEATLAILGDSAARTLRYQFEYDSELLTQRASIAIQSILETFRGEFFVIGGGFHQLIEAMEKEYRKRGGSIHLQHTVTSVEPMKDGRYGVQFRTEAAEAAEEEEGRIMADLVIVATDIEGIQTLLNPWMDISQLYQQCVAEPLLRIYAKFPTKGAEIDTGKESVWFSGVGKVATRKGIRYFIPVREDKGVAMISYTDGICAKAWQAMRDSEGDALTIELCMEQLRDVFHELDIPDPEWVDFSYWKIGSHYWLPGDVPIVGEIENVREQPRKRLFVMGECISPYYQAWVEGGLERVEHALPAIVQEINASKPLRVSR